MKYCGLLVPSEHISQTVLQLLTSREVIKHGYFGAELLWGFGNMEEYVSYGY